ncbi:MAG: DUF3108 domain-containing protein [Leptospiraceae bacterium]|nr:DUF3108 domain-containing protein [Leptospiraceae bacterium]MDW8306697.1 DUF3108 domain-containing protein [Leptospiraceae bacterium]
MIRILLLFCLVFALWGQTNEPSFYNETFVYTIQWKGMNVGIVKMQTKKGENSMLKTLAKVTSLDVMKSIYYVQGSFGSVWNYLTRRPNYAFEEIYQGETYQKRSFRFEGRTVSVEKHEQTFSETSFPHTGPLKRDFKDKYTKEINESTQDLLGAFYLIRSEGKSPKVGDVKQLYVLPAGSEKILILKVLDKKVIDAPFFGRKEIFHVKTALANPKDARPDEGNLFFNTKSQIEMLITNDNNFVPVQIWAEVPVIGRVDVILARYSQP